MNIVIIEDEKLLQEELILQLHKIEKVNILHCISTVQEGVSWLSENSDNLDLIFMDIELADGISFEILESVDVQTPIVFLTAYSEYAIKAFKVNSIDYLLKPLIPKDLVRALAKFKNIQSNKSVIDLNVLRELYAVPKVKTIDRVLVKSGDNFRFLPCQDIAYFMAEDKYTVVVTFGNQSHLIDDSLNNLELNLSNETFHRPSRKYIININAIVKASKYFNSRLKLFIEPSPENDIIISRTKIKEFLTWMGK